MSATTRLDMPDDVTSRRKDSHLDLCATGDVAPEQNSTLFDHVSLVHCAMPELSLSELDLSTSFFGKRLNAPILITGMTGGSERATIVNRELAQVAEEAGVAFGVGSQRAMLDAPALRDSFSVRTVAPTTVVLGNLGLVQLVKIGVDGARRLADDIAADALAVHLNPAQELTQPEGDRDFRGGWAALTALVRAMEGRVLVKETGCGISPTVARRLVDAGVRHIDVSGLGGTSWVRVEELRSEGHAREVGAVFSGWGIPTAAAVSAARRVVGPGVTLVASGGLRTGLDAAKALALGANLAGMALPLFRAQQAGGIAGARAALEVVLTSLRHALLLTGSRTPGALSKRPKVLSVSLNHWVESLLHGDAASEAKE